MPYWGQQRSVLWWKHKWRVRGSLWVYKRQCVLGAVSVEWWHCHWHHSPPCSWHPPSSLPPAWHGTRRGHWVSQPLNRSVHSTAWTLWSLGRPRLPALQWFRLHYCWSRARAAPPIDIATTLYKAAQSPGGRPQLRDARMERIAHPFGVA